MITRRQSTKLYPDDDILKISHLIQDQFGITGSDPSTIFGQLPYNEGDKWKALFDWLLESTIGGSTNRQIGPSTIFNGTRRVGGIPCGSPIPVYQSNISSYSPIITSHRSINFDFQGGSESDIFVKIGSQDWQSLSNSNKQYLSFFSYTSDGTNPWQLVDLSSGSFSLTDIVGYYKSFFASTIIPCIAAPVMADPYLVQFNGNGKQLLIGVGFFTCWEDSTGDTPITDPKPRVQEVYMNSTTTNRFSIRSAVSGDADDDQSARFTQQCMPAAFLGDLIKVHLKYCPGSVNTRAYGTPKMMWSEICNVLISGASSDVVVPTTIEFPASTMSFSHLTQGDTEPSMPWTEYWQSGKIAAIMLPVVGLRWSTTTYTSTHLLNVLHPGDSFQTNSVVISMLPFNINKLSNVDYAYIITTPNARYAGGTFSEDYDATRPWRIGKIDGSPEGHPDDTNHIWNVSLYKRGNSPFLNLGMLQDSNYQSANLTLAGYPIPYAVPFSQSAAPTGAPRLNLAILIARNKDGSFYGVKFKGFVLRIPFLGTYASPYITTEADVNHVVDICMQNLNYDIPHSGSSVKFHTTLGYEELTQNELSAFFSSVIFHS